MSKICSQLDRHVKIKDYFFLYTNVRSTCLDPIQETLGAVALFSLPLLFVGSSPFLVYHGILLKNGRLVIHVQSVSCDERSVPAVSRNFFFFQVSSGCPGERDRRTRGRGRKNRSGKPDLFTHFRNQSGLLVLARLPSIRRRSRH